MSGVLIRPKLFHSALTIYHAWQELTRHLWCER